MNEYLILVIFAVVAFIQNMAFTWSSRSRASGDPVYHRYASLASNGIWFVCQVLIMQQIWTSVQSGEWWAVAIAGVIYTIATSEGSVFMMRWLIKTEKGKRRVGSY
jgi:hypothetical protein